MARHDDGPTDRLRKESDLQASLWDWNKPLFSTGTITHSFRPLVIFVDLFVY